MFQKTRAGLPAPAVLCFPGFLLLCAGALQAQSLTVTPSGYPTVPVGGTLQFTATPSGFTIASLKWEVASIQGGSAATGTISTGLAGGLYTAPAAVPAQSTQTITAVATATTGSKYSASVFVTILPPPPIITSVSPNPLPVGSATVTVTGTGFTSSSTIWDSGVQYATQFTAPSTLTASVYTGPGTASATFTVHDSGNVSNAVAVPVGSAAKPTVYTLTVVNGTGSGSYAAGTVVNISANAAPSGQQFQSWSGAVVASATSAGTTLTMPAANTTVTAVYTQSTPTTYTLTVVNGTGGGSYTAGTAVNISANPAPSGQQFQSWSGATVANATSAGTTLTMPAANATVTASYAASPSSSSGGLTIGSVSPSPLPVGTVTVSITGAGFSASSLIWVGGVQYGTQFTAPNTLTASIYIAPGTPSVTFTVHSGGSVSNAVVAPVGGSAPATYTLTVVNGTGSGTYAAGAVVGITANPAPSGQQFQTWTGAALTSATSASTTLTMPAANTTVTAGYTAATPATYTLTVVNGTGGGSYAAGTVVNINANAAPSGQQFQNWTGAAVAGANSSATTLTMPAANTTVTAGYAASPSSGSGSLAIGSVSPNPLPTGTVTVTITGAGFSSSSFIWVGGVQYGTQLTTPNTLTASIYIAPGTPSVTFTVHSGGSVSNAVVTPVSGSAPTTCTLTVVNGTGSGSYAAGTVVPIAASPAQPGQSFQSWTGAVVAGATSASTTLTMPAANTTVTANFAASAMWTLTVVNGTGSGSYAAGTVVPIAANPAPAGLAFNSWSGAPVASSTSANTTLLMPAVSTTVSANYSAPPSGVYTVTYSAAGSTAGFAPSDPNQYSPGRPVTVPGNIGYLFNPGHSFVGWNTSVDGSGASYGVGATLIMGNSNVTLYPQWNTQDWPVSVWGGARAAIVLKADGSVWTWGMDTYGQLGNGATTDSSLPVQVLGPNGVGYLSGVIAVMGGEEHNLALKSDGTVWDWGENQFNQLGNGNTTNSSTPIQVSGLSSIVSIASRGYHSLAMKSDGTVWAWGEDKYGALGNGVVDSNPDYQTPVQVQGLSNPLMVTGGYYFNVALMPDHTLMAWGNNLSGELGDGTTTSRSTPVPVQGIDHVIWVSAGWDHTVAIKSDGTVWTWGSNNWDGIYPGSGMLGDGTTLDHSLPAQVPGLAGAIQASGGDSFTSVLLKDGTVWTFGSNSGGQLGTGSFNPAQSLVPVQVQGLGNIVSITARDHHNQAIDSSGTVWSWGSGENGELGNGTVQNSPTVVQVTWPGGN